MVQGHVFFAFEVLAVVFFYFVPKHQYRPLAGLAYVECSNSNQNDITVINYGGR